MRRPAIAFALLLAALFALRLAYGLASEFWFEDELQVYLIGLKSFTTRTWPWMGPDVVYTHTQIPGALQGLLVGLPFFVAPVAEAPAVFLNALTFGSLALLAWYVCRRFPALPRWLVWTWVMTAPWTLNYGTRGVNPSYVLIFSAPFFVAFLDTLLHGSGLIGRKASFFVVGLAITCIMQLHLSWVLLVPFAALALGWSAAEDRRVAPGVWALFGAGCIQVGLLLAALFRRHVGRVERKLGWIIVGTVLLTCGAFLFSIKEPEAHTFAVLVPLALYYSFQCYAWLFAKREAWLRFLEVAVIVGVLFSAGMALHNLRHRSLYQDRARVERAIELRDYTHLGLRRSDLWGYGY